MNRNVDNRDTWRNNANQLRINQRQIERNLYLRYRHLTVTGSLSRKSDIPTAFWAQTLNMYSESSCSFWTLYADTSWPTSATLDHIIFPTLHLSTWYDDMSNPPSSNGFLHSIVTESELISLMRIGPCGALGLSII